MDIGGIFLVAVAACVIYLCVRAWLRQPKPPPPPVDIDPERLTSRGAGVRYEPPAPAASDGAMKRPERVRPTNFAIKAHRRTINGTVNAAIKPQFRIEYADEDGVVTERDVFLLAIREDGDLVYCIVWCFVRNDARTLRADRILSASDLMTGKSIESLSPYLFS
ncbi:WYL domain-containing protein [Camelimonas sp. ID_303_24]